MQDRKTCPLIHAIQELNCHVKRFYNDLFIEVFQSQEIIFYIRKLYWVSTRESEVLVSIIYTTRVIYPNEK